MNLSNEQIITLFSTIQSKSSDGLISSFLISHNVDDFDSASSIDQRSIIDDLLTMESDLD